MVETFVSKEKTALARGEAFGARFAARIAENIEIYQRLLLLPGKRSIDEIRSFADRAFTVVRSHSPGIAEEIQGMARGANVPLSDVMTLNARTELLAACGGFVHPECSVVISLNSTAARAKPVALQTWDWLSHLNNGWLLWEIEADDGHVLRTLTEYGIVGKIGVSSAGMGVMLNILAHASDGQLPIGLPVHVAARSILDARADLHRAIARISSAPISASSSLSVLVQSGDEATAFSLELFPGGPAYCLPSETGLLIHTNHFLSAAGSTGDRAPKFGPSTFIRYEQLRRRLHGKGELNADEILQALSSHVGGPRAACSHPIPDAPFGEKTETVATVQIDVRSAQLRARKGGPCTPASWTQLGP